jgi:PIN domain nuclease of toxin-antitoxin system
LSGLLLDSHVFLWWAHQPDLLPGALHEMLASPENQIVVSMATAWELTIKQSLGKLMVPGNMSEALQQNDIRLLPIDLAHIEAIRQLPMHHGDPFDRLLIAQARIENLTIVSRDRWFDAYDVDLLRA